MRGPFACGDAPGVGARATTAILEARPFKGACVLEFVEIPVGAGASLRCARCGAAPEPAYHATADVAARIAAVAADWTVGPGPNLTLTGPEPFDHPALPDLVIACQTAGVERICIETDGRALAIPANAEGAVGAGVTHMRVRLLSADPGTADKVSGRPGLLAATGAGVAAVRAAAERQGVMVVITAAVPVCAHNLDTVPATVGQLSAWGVDAVRLLAAGALPARSADILAAACDTGMVNRLWVECAPDLPLPASHELHRVEEPVGRVG